jgi:tRNA threonylcarbamoyladenosine biosynthesis protein TsaE
MQVERIEQGLQITAHSERDTECLGQALARVVQPGTVIALVGPLGAGKTRLVRALAESLGVDPGAIASPTFVLIHEYEGTLPVYHFDAYRLSSAEEFAALGPADYWASEGVCLVEWADRVPDCLPDDVWTIRIEPTGPESRRFELLLPPGSDAAETLERRLREAVPGVV